VHYGETLCGWKYKRKGEVKRKRRGHSHVTGRWSWLDQTLGSRSSHCDMAAHGAWRLTQAGANARARPVMSDRTRPVMKNYLWMLTRNDRTPRWGASSHTNSTSDLTITGTGTRVSRCGAGVSGPA
jgi:erythromycin esterase-like protein